jgi:hypothetical protein
MYSAGARKNRMILYISVVREVKEKNFLKKKFL